VKKCINLFNDLGVEWKHIKQMDDKDATGIIEEVALAAEPTSP
jgi:hypothetical protein